VPESLTIGVIHRHVRGYPQICLESLGAAEPAEGVEYLWVTDQPRGEVPFPAVRKVILHDGDRATAKNLAIAEARGEWLLLTASDMVAGAGAAEIMRSFLASAGRPAVASAQILAENGMRRRSAFAFPTLLGEWNPLSCFRRWSTGHPPRGRPPQRGRPYRVQAVRAAFLMARREVFDLVGPFAQGYRFGFEDVEWCWRAARCGVFRYVVPEAHAFCLAPQERGLLGPAHFVEISRSMERMVAASRGNLYAFVFRAMRRLRWLGPMPLLEVLNLLRCGRSPSLRKGVARYRALLGLNHPKMTLPADVESRVRWEGVV